MLRNIHFSNHNMPPTGARRVSNSVSDANYCEFDLAYYKYHPDLGSVSFEKYLEDGTHEKEMNAAKEKGREEHRSDRYYSSSSWGNNARSHGFEPTNRDGLRVPLSRDAGDTPSRGLGDRSNVGARNVGDNIDEQGPPRGLGGRHISRRDIEVESLAREFDGLRFGRVGGRHGPDSHSHTPRSRYAADDFDIGESVYDSRDSRSGAGVPPRREERQPCRGHREAPSPPRSRRVRGSSHPRQHRQTHEYSRSYGAQGGRDGRVGGCRYA